jgi:hypothetical protein
MEQVKLRVKYGTKFGEVIVLNDQVFFVMDLEQQTKIFKKGKIDDVGKVSNLKDSSLEELEQEITKPFKPRKVFISNTLMVSLDNVFGGTVEILMN